MSPIDGKKLTFSQFSRFVKGRRGNEERELDRVRYLAYTGLVGAGAKVKKPQDLFKLPSEMEDFNKKNKLGEEAWKRYQEKHLKDG